MNRALRYRLEAIAILIGSFVLAVEVVTHRMAVQHWLGHIGIAAYPMAVLIFAVVASAPFSVTDALAVMNGVMFGPWVGSVVNAFGIVCAAIVGYSVARRTSELLDLDTSLAKLPKWVRHFRVGSPAFLIAVRILPGIGGTIATQTAAAMRVPVGIHVMAMSVVAIPICTLLAIFGDGFANQLHAYYRAHRPHLNIHRPHLHLPLHVGHTPAPEEQPTEGE